MPLNGNAPPRRPPPAPPPPIDAPEQAVQAGLRTNNQGAVSSAPHNVRYVLERDSRWAARFWFNTYAHCVMIEDRRTREPSPLTDDDEADFDAWVENVYLIVCNPTVINRSIRVVARTRPFDPLLAWLDTLKWDGVHRLQSTPEKLWGNAPHSNADGTPHPEGWLPGQLFMRWMISAVARAYVPGCKADCALILYGGQGVKKSTTLEVLVGSDYFNSSPFDLKNKYVDSVQKLSTAWVHEIAELEGLRGAAETSIKTFMATAHDTARFAYGRHQERRLRRCVLAGSTNERFFLNDPTGSRRFWPIETVGRAADYWAEAHRDQLWAEAVAAFRVCHSRGMIAGGRHRAGPGQYWLTDNEEAQLRHTNKAFEDEDPWTSLAVTWLGGDPQAFTTAEILIGAIEVESKNVGNRGYTKRMANILRSLGYRSKREYVDSRRLSKLTRWRRVAAAAVDGAAE